MLLPRSGNVQESGAPDSACTRGTVVNRRSLEGWGQACWLQGFQGTGEPACVQSSMNVWVWPSSPSSWNDSRATGKLIRGCRPPNPSSRSSRQTVWGKPALIAASTPVSWRFDYLVVIARRRGLTGKRLKPLRPQSRRTPQGHCPWRRGVEESLVQGMLG